MMKTVSFIFAAAALVALASCSGKKVRKEKMPEPPDSTLYVRLDSLGSDTLYVTSVESRGKRRLGYLDAQRGGKVAGDLVVGDTLAVVPDFKRRALLSSVNLSRLLGLWMFEGGDGTGMRLEADGAACGIGMTEVTLREWKLRNGFFILSYVKADGSDYTEVADTSHIEKLDADEFVFTLRGKAHVCRRNKG